MNARAVWGAVVIGAAVWTSGGRAADKDKPSADDVAKAEKAVTEQLEKKKAQGFVMAQIKDEAVERALPKVTFFAVLFKQFPVGRVPPEGMNASNVFAVGADGKPQLLIDAEKLTLFAQDNLAPVKSDDDAKDAARAFVRLAQEFSQDGFYEFKLQDDSTKVTKEKDGKTAASRTMATKGGNGEIKVTLSFDDAGKLTKSDVHVDLKPGPRPICQATKLLDADPIVRQLAEQDLRCMGRAAKPYLDEQRAKAAPGLREAIDRMWERICAQER
jgi:hypothetical protein